MIPPMKLLRRVTAVAAIASAASPLILLSNKIRLTQSMPTVLISHAFLR